MNPEKAELVVRLWRTGQFDTAEIDQFVRASEADVWRIIGVARAIAKDMSKQMVQA